MAIKTYLHIGTSLTELINLKDLKIKQEINEHVSLTLTAILKEESEINYIRNTNAYATIEVGIEEPEYRPIFKGIVKDIEIKKLDKVHYLSI